jgi:hypothetical protein
LHNCLKQIGMKKLGQLILILIGVFVFFETQAQSNTKRKLSNDELIEMIDYSDSIRFELKRLYKRENREKAPNKYQPERNAYIRAYLVLFSTIKQYLNTVKFSETDIIKILGKPNEIQNNDGQVVYVYSSLDKLYVKAKNFKYTLIFRNNELIDLQIE